MSLASCAASSNGANRDAKRDRDRARPRRSNKVKTRRVSQHTDVAFVEPTLSKPLSRPAPSCDAASLPGLIVYDLDDTIWFPELYMIAGAPFVKTSKSTVVDSGGARLGCYPSGARFRGAREVVRCVSRARHADRRRFANAQG